MKTPFKYTFRDTIQNIPKRQVLEDFKNSFDKSHCDFVAIISEQQLIVENEIWRLKPDLNFNLWIGIGDASVNISDSRDNNKLHVKYIIDYTKLIVSYFLLYLIFIVPVLIFGKTTELIQTISLELLLLTLVFILSLSIAFYRHRKIFKRTLNKKLKNLGGYDWDRIIGNMSDKELKRIINKEREFPEEMLFLVEKQFQQRKETEHKKTTGYNTGS